MKEGDDVVGLPIGRRPILERMAGWDCAVDNGCDKWDRMG